MENILSDCPFVRSIMELPQPKRVLLLGSGITKAPKEWLAKSELEMVLFNSRCLDAEYYKNLPVFAVICWKKTLPDCQSYFRAIDQRPYIIILDDHVYPKIDLNNKLLIFDDGHRESQDHVGKWYTDVSRIISEKSGKKKIFTTGFYMTLWLLAGPQKEIYIAGFDGYKQNSLMHHIDGSTALPYDNKSHDYNQEWFFIEKAIEIAKTRGVQVHLVQN